MPVLNFKYVVFSCLIIHSPIVSDFRISSLTSVECLWGKDIYCLFFAKNKILKTFITN